MRCAIFICQGHVKQDLWLSLTLAAGYFWASWLIPDIAILCAFPLSPRDSKGRAGCVVTVIVTAVAAAGH